MADVYGGFGSNDVPRKKNPKPGLPEAGQEKRLMPVKATPQSGGKTKPLIAKQWALQDFKKAKLRNGMTKG
jgi:hypothetical protein